MNIKIFEKNISIPINFVFWILAASVIGYWPISFLVSNFKWDALEITIPWRFYIGECLNNGSLPLWYPYQCMGFGQFLDNQTWYWIPWLLSIGGYTNLTFHFEFVLHIFLAGLGFYYFATYLNIPSKISLLFAIIFIYSGFFIGNLQHFGWIVSGTWIPYILLNYLKLLRTHKFKYALSTSIFYYFLISGGYWGFTITITYTIVIIALYKLCSFLIVFKRINIREFILFIKGHLTLLISCFLLSLVVIVSVLDSYNLMYRGEPLSNDYIIASSILPRNLLTFFIPFATYKDWTWWITDPAMSNLYIGAFTLFLILINAFEYGIKRDIVLCLIFASFFLMISMGQSFPFRQWMSDFLPGYNYIRFPPQFRYFTILFLLIAGALSFKNLRNRESDVLPKVFLVISIVYMLITLILIYVAISKMSLSQIAFSPDQISIVHLAIFQIVLVSVIFSLFWYFSKKQLFKISVYRLLGYFIVLEMLISVQLNIGHTGVNLKESPLALNTLIAQSPAGFPIPSNKISFYENSKVADSISPGLKNNETFLKILSYKGNTPYQYSSWNVLELTGIFQDLIRKPLIYCTPDSNLKAVIVIKQFQPNLIEFEVDLINSGVLHLQQNFHHAWQASINGQDAEIKKDNITLMSIEVPKGKQQVKFKFKPEKVIIAFYISFISFIIAVFLFIVLQIRSKIKS